MKKLLLVLLLIPALLCAETKEEKKAREKAKKEAVKELKAVLKKYPHWKWDGQVHEDKIAQDWNITISTGDNVQLYISFMFSEAKGKKESIGSMVSLRFPSHIMVAWAGKAEGPKTLKIAGRVKGGPTFITNIHSNRSPYRFYFKPGKITAEDGSKIDPMVDIFYSEQFFFEYPTSYFSDRSGTVYQIELETAGVSEILDYATNLALL